MIHPAFKTHLMTAHYDEILAGLRRKYTGYGSPPACLSLLLADNEKEIYVCACCQNIWFSEKTYKDHYILSECKNLSKHERQIAMEQFTGLTFPNLHKEPAPATQTKSNVCVCEAEIARLEKQIAELLAWKNSIIAAAPPANEIVEPPPAAVIERALIADLSGNALKRTMSEPNMAPGPERRVVFSNMTELPVEEQMPKLSAFQQQVAAAMKARVAKLAAMKSVSISPQNKPTCVHCEVQDDYNYVSCAKCQKPMHFRNELGHCAGKLRMCAHEDCEDAQFCEKCASKILGPEDEDEDEDDLCARHRA